MELGFGTGCGRRAYQRCRMWVLGTDRRLCWRFLVSHGRFIGGDRIDFGTSCRFMNSIRDSNIYSSRIGPADAAFFHSRRGLRYGHPGFNQRRKYRMDSLKRNLSFVLVAVAALVALSGCTYITAMY